MEGPEKRITRLVWGGLLESSTTKPFCRTLLLDACCCETEHNQGGTLASGARHSSSARTCYARILTGR